MAKHNQSAFRRLSASGVVEISKDESENESEPDLLQFSMTKNFNHAQHERRRRLELPTTETPIRPQLAAASLTLSDSSSSTISSIFSTSSNGPGTPLTPPLLETQNFYSSKAPRAENYDKTSRLLFVKKGTREVGQFSTTGYSSGSATLARSPSRPSTPNVPTDGVDYTTVANLDELASCLGALSLNSLSVARQLQRRKMVDQVLETVGNILDGEHEPQISNIKSGLLTAVASQDERIMGRNGDAVPSLPLVAGSPSRRTIDHDRPTVNRNERNELLNTPIILSKYDGNIRSEVKVSGGDISTSDGADEFKARHTRSKESHKRSRSLDLQNTAIHSRPKVGVSDTGSGHQQLNGRSGSLSVPILESITKGGRRASSGVPKLCSTLRKSRRRLTGSIPEAKKPPPPIRTSGRPNDERGSTISTSESVHVSNAEIDRNPITGRQATPYSVADPTERIPIFLRYKEMASETDVKLGVLRVLRRTDEEKQLKSRRLSTKTRDIWNEIWDWTCNDRKKRSKPRDGFIYVFKCNAFPPGHVKIGQTSQPWPMDRLRDWKLKCKITGILIPDPNDKRCKHYDIVERIVHAELMNERRIYSCWCRTKHQLMIDNNNTTRSGHNEWFQIGEGKALETVEKWRRWVVQMQPYKKDGSLRACWIWKHDRAMIEKDIDWASWQEFGWLETIQCCCHCLDTWVGNLWPAGGKIPLSPELLALGLAVAFPLYISSFSIQSCVIFLAILSLYVFLWFNYS